MYIYIYIPYIILYILYISYYIYIVNLPSVLAPHAVAKDKPRMTTTTTIWLK